MSSCMSNRQRGLAMVELALLLPIMLMVTFGSTEFARALFQEQALTKAAISGLRYMTRAYNAVDDDCSTGPRWSKSVQRARILAVKAGLDAPIVPDLEVGDVQITVQKRSVTAPLGDVCVINVSIEVPFRSIFGDTMVPFTSIRTPVLNSALEGVYVGD